jgi:hypothetical protein
LERWFDQQIEKLSKMNVTDMLNMVRWLRHLLALQVGHWAPWFPISLISIIQSNYIWIIDNVKRLFFFAQNVTKYSWYVVISDEATLPLTWHGQRNKSLSHSDSCWEWLW